MARPKKDEKNKRQYKITVRFDDPEYAKITSEARSVGITLSKYVREKIKRGFVRVNPYAKVDAAAINQLSKLGGLLKIENLKSGKLYSVKTDEILGDIQALIMKIRSQAEDDRQARTESQGA